MINIEVVSINYSLFCIFEIFTVWGAELTHRCIRLNLFLARLIRL